MTPTERAEWLAALKAGDQVLVVRWPHRSLAPVQRRTPSGQIVVGVRRFGPAGVERTGHDDPARLEPPTQADRDRDEAEALVHRLAYYVSWRALPLATLREVARLVEAAEKETP